MCSQHVRATTVFPPTHFLGACLEHLAWEKWHIPCDLGDDAPSVLATVESLKPCFRVVHMRVPTFSISTSVRSLSGIAYQSLY